MEKLNKRKLLIILSIFVCIVIVLCLNEIRSFDGYYRSIDDVIAHQKETKNGAEKIALIENGSGYIAVMNLEESLSFYSFKSKNTITGKKYAVAHTSTKTINYSAITETYPNYNEWNIFSSIVVNNSDEKDLYWYVVQKTDSLEIENNMMCFEYSYNGTKSCLLCLLIS